LNQELEQRVRDRTQELQAANADLESFSYSVSHDLRAPLRVVDGYCQMFMDEFGAGIAPHGREILGKARAGATRMNQLIDDLLRLARFSRQPLHTRPVETGALVKRVVANLQEQLQGRSVQFEIGALPDCVADAALLEQVFTNLLSNALKFTAGRPNTRIEVGSSSEGAEQIYFVKDNGVGFDMRYAERLFGVFQRLHSQAEFAGTGIGLSIVHRIIRRHGGRTWAEGALQQGATFYFTLPRGALA
jgi:light-regulated signal transduction histidine kinase (bacteriophytochrome)